MVRHVFDRLQAGDDTVLDELVAEDFVNHAAPPQGRAGWRQTIAQVEHDLPRTGGEIHHLFGDDVHVCLHLSIHGVHAASTMPLLASVPVTGRTVTWRFVHIFRVEDGRIVEHWAARDDVDLLRQVDGWPSRG